jgi:hypothetical protein
MDFLVFLDQQITAHNACERLGYALVDYQKIEFLFAALQGVGNWDKHLYEFNSRYMTLADRTWARVMEHFPAYDVLRRSDTTSAAAGYANAAIEQLSAANVSLQAQIDDLKSTIKHAAAVKPAAATESGRGGGGSAGGGGSPVSYYCWSHGPNPTHGSDNCLHPRLDTHDKRATLQNKLGGAPFTWSMRLERMNKCGKLPHS